MPSQWMVICLYTWPEFTEVCLCLTQAYDKAEEDVQNSQSPEPFKDSALIMELLRDNLTVSLSVPSPCVPCYMFARSLSQRKQSAVSLV